MDIKTHSIVTLWNGSIGKVLSTVGNKVNVLLSTGVRKFISASEVESAIETFSEKEAKFLAAKDRLTAHKNAVATKSVLAPGKVDEPKWEKAIDAVKESSGKNKSDFGDKEWATVNTVYQNMGGRFKSKKTAVWVVYDPTLDKEISRHDTEKEANTARYDLGIEGYTGLTVIPEDDEDAGTTTTATQDEFGNTPAEDPAATGNPGDVLGVKHTATGIELQFKSVTASYTPTGEFISATAAMHDNYKQAYASLIAEGAFNMQDIQAVKNRILATKKKVAGGIPTDEQSFIDYVQLYYSSIDLTKADIKKAIKIINTITPDYDWAWDSVDRERVKDVVMVWRNQAAIEASNKITVIKASIIRTAARLGNYDFDVHGGKTWKTEAADDGKAKISRVTGDQQ